MFHFTLLLFDQDDRVCAVRTIRAKGNADAAHIANVAVLTHPASAGYQLWYCGEKIVGTYPRETTIRADQPWERGQRPTALQGLQGD